LLDLILNVNQSSRTFAGGLIIGAGLMANMAFEKWRPDGIKSK
jgi:hypothetical protein